MPTLRAQFNYAFTELTERGEGQSVGVFTKNGQVRTVRWLGFMAVDEARQLRSQNKGLAVRLDIKQYSDESYAVTFKDVPKDAFVMGCLTDKGVYGVFEPRVRFMR